MERRIIYDFVNVINGEAKLTQALVKVFLFIYFIFNCLFYLFIYFILFVNCVKKLSNAMNEN